MRSCRAMAFRRALPISAIFPAPRSSNALTQLAGQPATGAQTSAFQLLTDFMNLLSDPSSGGGGSPTGGGAPGFAPEQEASLPSDIAAGLCVDPDKNAGAATKLRPALDRLGFGLWRRRQTRRQSRGRLRRCRGKRLRLCRRHGLSCFAQHSLYGFALAGGGTDWDLAQGLGGGRSDSVPGRRLRQNVLLARLYLSARLAFANPWFTTNRIALGDQLDREFRRPELCRTASKAATAWSGQPRSRSLASRPMPR